MTTTASDTELSAVNSILGSIGQSPITSLTIPNPEIQLIQNILNETNKDIQNEGWHFNHEEHVEVTPSNNEIAADASVLRYDLHDDHLNRSKDLIVKDGKLYDKVNHTYEWGTDELHFNVVYLFTYDDLPSVFKRYITYKAAGRAATQMVTNPQLVQLLQVQEQMARASCMEYECNQGDYNMLGMPHNTHYSTYKPYRALQR